MREQKSLIAKIKEQAMIHAPAGTMVIEHNGKLHIPSPSQRSWIEILPEVRRPLLAMAEYRAGRQPAREVADSDRQVITWLIERWNKKASSTDAGIVSAERNRDGTENEHH